MGKTIVVLAKFDLFSECLMQAMGKQFLGHNIVGHDKLDVFFGTHITNVELILVYQIAQENFSDVLRGIRNFYPGAAIGLLVKHADELGASINGYVADELIHGLLPLNLRLEVCLAAVELLMKGGEHFPSALLSRLSRDAVPAQSYHMQAGFSANDGRRLRQVGIAGFTTREVQIFDLICKGTQHKVIAWTLKLSENTVKVHARNIYRKLKVRNRTEATSRYFL